MEAAIGLLRGADHIIQEIDELALIALGCAISLVLALIRKPNQVATYAEEWSCIGFCASCRSSCSAACDCCLRNM